MKDLEIYELMGKLVVVDKILERQSSPVGPIGTKSQWKTRSIKKRQGWVTGLRWLQSGIRIPESHTGYPDEDSYEPPYFKQTERPTKCLIVVFWPTEKPVFVPMDGYLTLPEDEVERMFFSLSVEVPHRTTWRDKITDPNKVKEREESEERVRELMRKESKEQPRDKKGKWIAIPQKQGEKDVCD